MIFLRASALRLIRSGIFCRNHKVDAAARVEMARHRHPFGLARLDHRVENEIGHVLVKIAFIAETP